MRLRWSQHVYRTRMLLISLAQCAADQAATTAWLMQNPNDIADIYAQYYTPEVAHTIANLLTEHLQIGAELITALRDNKTTQAAALDKKWYANADEMAKAFSSINPYYPYDKMRDMLYMHLDLTKKEVAARLARNYTEDMAAFDVVEREAMKMADILSLGIQKQFPRKFR